ncbi:unnamed protein product [Camellia sinensis]
MYIHVPRVGRKSTEVLVLKIHGAFDSHFPCPAKMAFKVYWLLLTSLVSFARTMEPNYLSVASAKLVLCEAICWPKLQKKGEHVNFMVHD